MLEFNIEDFQPAGSLSTYKEKPDSEEDMMMSVTPLRETYNLQWYMGYDEDEFDHPLSEPNWTSQTRGKYMKFLIMNSTHTKDFKATSNQKLVSFKKGIKREDSVYPTLKDERYFNGFSRSLYITAKSHECEQVLDPDYIPKEFEKELFHSKQIFMFAVFDKHLLTDMGKTIVRRYVHDMDAQSVWKDFQDHMKSSSKDSSEKRRLTQYVTNTVLDDNYKGTAEQFVLQFNEQFRQLAEISDESEHFLPQVKLWLLQNAVRPINDLRIVETLDEFQSITTGYGKSSNIK